MAKINQGILGGFSGSIANVTGGSWKGIAYMRSKPTSVANPKTAGQVSQRTKFSAVVATAKILLSEIIKPLWDRFAQRESGYNAFVSANIGAYNANGQQNSAQLVISQGTLQGFQNLDITGQGAANTLTINWTDNSGEGFALATDQVYVAAFVENNELWQADAQVAIRSDGNVVVPITIDWEELETAYIYVAFRRADGTLVSNRQVAEIVIDA